MESTTRHALLETVRQYAREQLDRAGEYPAVAWRHRAWLLALAEEAESPRAGPEQGRWLERLESEHDCGGVLNFYLQSLILRQEVGEKQGIAETLEGMAAVYVEMGQAERAAYALGAAEALREATGAFLSLINQAAHAACAAAIRTALGDAAEAAWARGRASSLDAMLAFLTGAAAPASA